MRIEIITTPNTELKETGFGELKACESVLGVIRKAGYDVKLSVCKNKEDLEGVLKRKPHLVILAVKYLSLKDQDDIWLADYFAMNGINFTGSSREVLKYDSDKVKAKIRIKSLGIGTAKYFIAVPGEYKLETDLPIKFPLFLKPMDAANGNGVDDLSLVANFSEYESKVSSLHEEFNLPVLVEEYLDGREYTVAVIKTLSGTFIVSSIEIVPPQSTKGLRILGQKVKNEDSETLRKIDDIGMKKRIGAMAVDVFVGLGVRNYGRIDIKTNKNGDCFFMEANLVPGMTNGSSYFPKACEIENKLSYEKVIELLFCKGLGRKILRTRRKKVRGLGNKVLPVVA